MFEVIEEAKPRFIKAVEFLQSELSTIRTGRATPALVENIMVEAYGAETPVKGLATINVPDAKTLVVDPWDKSVLKNIETAIRKADIGINPVVDSNILRLVMPEMTEENRKEMVKKMKERLEEAKVKIRAVREEARSRIGQMEKDKEISEDEKYKYQEDLDKATKEHSEKIDQIGKAKEEEIMTI
ncbi:MAG: ribosome recycling factor [Candidatus Uhrbacteria bacterium]